MVSRRQAHCRQIDNSTLCECVYVYMYVYVPRCVYSVYVCVCGRTTARLYHAWLKMCIYVDMITGLIDWLTDWLLGLGLSSSVAWDFIIKQNNGPSKINYIAIT
jgi:hypothetical protein